MLKKFLIAVIFPLIFIFNVCSAQLKIHMLNVGQGDAILVQTDEQNILIDTSDVDERDKLKRELYKFNAFTIDKLILTHPHADHIGNAAFLIQSGVFKVKSVYDNGILSASKMYMNYVNECRKRNVPLQKLNAGDLLDFGEGCKFIILAPAENYVNLINSADIKGDPNNESIIARLEYGNFSMMFTGDAEQPAEEKILSKLQPCNILKAGHHGSKTSSSAKFLSKLKPQYVLISAGEQTKKRGGNTYGHPHVQALERFISAGVDKKNIFCTSRNGSISVVFANDTFAVTPQVPAHWIDLYFIQSIGFSL